MSAIESQTLDMKLVAYLIRENRDASVYGIRVKGQIEPFYVGSTKQSLHVRLRHHLCEINRKKHKNTHFARKVVKVGIENVEIYLIETVAQLDRFRREHEIIRDYQSHGVYLTNIRSQSWPTTRDYLDPNTLAHNVIAALTAPEACEVPQNQVLYSKLRNLARDAVISLIKDNGPELLQMLRGQHAG